MDRGDDLVTTWHDHRRTVLDVAYRMLGSLTEAEDVAQDVFERLARQDRTAILDLRGWLIAVTARRSLDRLRSAEVSRRAYVGPWLPEPVATHDDADPADRVTLDDTVRIALLTMLERLTPAERTVFVLHDVFALPFPEISAVVGRSVAACRQLASRARRHVRSSDRRFDVDPAEHRVAVERFAAACEVGDLEALTAVLDPDVTGTFDAGGRVPGAPSRTVAGARRVASLLHRSFEGRPARFVVAPVNAEPGIVVVLDGAVVAVLALDVSSGRVQHVHAVGNPEKLRYVAVAPPGP